MKILLINPPMTQLNTPYPATAYLTGFLHQQGFQVSQCDLALELLLKMFSREGLKELFRILEEQFSDVDDDELPDSVFHFFNEFSVITQCIDPCIRFLQGQDPSLALRIATRRFLPEGPQFYALDQMEDISSEILDQAFGTIGIQDKGKYLATLFINDIAAAIKEGIDPCFEITRYGERLASSNPSFDDLYRQLTLADGYTGSLINKLTESHINEQQPDVLGITVPFPGNMLGALQIAKYCRRMNPVIKIVLGGGYINTELRSLDDPRIFEFIDFMTLDDGERPFLTLLEYLQGHRPIDHLFRVFRLNDGQVQFHPQHTGLQDFTQRDIGTPSYRGLPLDRYLSLCEMMNPMHRIWSDGRWNKLTVAHGCYWKKCSFCDINLNYIRHYDDAGADLLVQRIEELINETGQTGFHFVDEAAPPKVLFAMAEKLIDKGIVISWWGNIRFEKTFTPEKCQLLADSGCIAVSGGLEAASDRLLKLMKKGVSVEHVARVTHNFSNAGILVHAYLMYGFPSQTEMETVESLEWVRQMMLNNCFQSAYWHRFAATIHSPVGLHPERYNIRVKPRQPIHFAENDIEYIDPVTTDHELLGRGLKKALYNYMHGIGFEYPLDFWFDKTVKCPNIDPDTIRKAITS